jgi:hypothetical protein
MTRDFADMDQEYQAHATGSPSHETKPTAAFQFVPVADLKYRVRIPTHPIRCSDDI